MTDSQTLTEILDRMRRMETRLTKLCIHHGVPTNAQKPTFERLDGGHALLQVPTPNSSLREIMDAIPIGTAQRVTIRAGSETLGVFIPS